MNLKKILGFISLAIAMFMGTLDSTIVNIALPDINRYFNSNLNDTSWISTIYVLGMSVFIITASKLADQFGRKKLMLIGLAVFGASSALCGLSQSLPFLIAVRFAQGIGGAIITPIVVPMGLEIFGKAKGRAVAAGIGAIVALAAAGGPPLGGIFIKYIDWQAIFFINVPFALISFVLIAFFVSESYDRSVSKSIDLPGIVLLTASLSLVTFALLKGYDYGWGSALIISMFVCSAVAIALFILTESRVKAPMLELSLFRESTFTASSICYLLVGFGIASPILIFNYFLQDVLGYEAIHAAFIVMAASLTVIVSMPLGSLVASKLGSKPVNFLGVLTLGISAFLLSRLNTGTSTPAMVADMIVCGIGLGFSSQSIVSSLKFLPEEKSGIGSGIVNSARMIGTCIGIALLVSILNTNLAGAKDDIRKDAIADVKLHTDIAPQVKDVMLKDIGDIFSSSSENSADSQDMQKKIQDDVQQALASMKSAPRPGSSDVLEKLYDGADVLSTGAEQALDGQKKMDEGIGSLDRGLGDLGKGGSSLSAGLKSLENGLEAAFSGSKQLGAASSQGIDSLFEGIGRLNDGTQDILQQFSKSGDKSNPTIYDGVDGVAAGAKNLSSSVSSYVSSVDNTIYYMIKNNPYSPQLLDGYEKGLEQAEALYRTADGTAGAQLLQQMQMLENIIGLYKAALDPSVKDESQFETVLVSIGQDNEEKQNIVASGGGVINGMGQIEAASQKIADQFGDGGKFKDGFIRLADGVHALYLSRDRLDGLQSGVNKLIDTLSQLKEGSSKLYAGSQSLENELSSVKSGSGNLVTASSKLVGAGQRLSEGAAQIASGVAMAGQKTGIESAMDSIKADKDDKIARAFSKTFLTAALILMLASICGLFTDRKEKYAGEAALK